MKCEITNHSSQECAEKANHAGEECVLTANTCQDWNRALPEPWLPSQVKAGGQPLGT